MSAGYSRKEFLIQAGNFRLSLGRQTKIMGVLNLTPDSFSQDGILVKSRKDLNRVLVIAEKLVRDGADILDVGGESTRPGSRRISVKEEIKRVIPTVRVLASKIRVPISVDTYKSAVARHALDTGANLINNIKGTQLNSPLLKMVSRYNAALVVMHIRGTPQTMQAQAHYKNFLREVLLELRHTVEKCLDAGIKRDKIIIDPGIGFGKTLEHNLELIQHLNNFQVLNCPILVGPSRKSFIGRVLNKDVSQRLIGTIAAVCASILNGAHIVRVHDVKKVKEAVRMTDAILNPHAWQVI